MFSCNILFPECYYEIVSEIELGVNTHGDTDVVNKCIRIREDVYEGAISGNGRDRMTIAHKIAHYILLVVCGVKFSRCFDGADIPIYQDPEGKVKALAEELMCAACLIVNMNPYQITNECGVSLDAAEYQFKKVRGDAYCLQK